MRLVSSLLGILKKEALYKHRFKIVAVFGLATFGVHMTGAYIRNPTCPVFVRDERS